MSRRSELVGRRVASITRRVGRRSGGQHLELLLLAAALIPIAVAVLRAVMTGWVPLGDGGYFIARSRDVLTAHHPLVGALSAGSTAADTTVNNLGPLQLDLLAPSTKLDQRWGAALGGGVLSAAAIVGTWLTVRRICGVIGVTGVMLATIGLEATIGSALLIDTRQQVTLLLPLWCLLWLVTAMWTGHLWALPWAAFTASLLVQTHLSYSYLTAALTIVGSIMLARHVRGHWRSSHAGRWLLITGGVLVLCWAQTIWDQLFDSANFTTAMSAADTSGVGTSMGVRLIADAVLVPPFWAPGSISSYLASDLVHEPSVTTPVAVFVVVAWAAAIAVVVFAARRWKHGLVRACAEVSLVALAAALLTATRIPTLPASGLAPQNYFWLWPLGAYFTVAVGAGVLLAATRARDHDRLPVMAGPGARRLGAVTVAVVVALSAVVALRVRDYWPQAPYDADFAGQVLDDLDAALDDHEIDGPIVLPFFWGVDEDSFNYTMLTVLQDHDIEFVFPTDRPNVERFGSDRCMSGSEDLLLRTEYGRRDVEVADDEVILVDIDELPADEADELDALDATFGERLRDGTIEVDLGAAEFFGATVPRSLNDVLETPGTPANGLAGVLGRWTAWKIVDVPEELAGEWDHWVELQRRAEVSRFAIILSPNHITDDERTC